MDATPSIEKDPPSDQQQPPVLSLQPEQIEGLLEQLEIDWQRFAGQFQRREQRAWGLKYLQGRLMAAGTYYTQPMAWRLGETNVRCLQNVVGASPWDDDALLWTHQRMVEETLGEVEGRVIVDGTGFPRKGETSVGVARQYCNQTGKIENCQVGVLATYASGKGYRLLDRRLYVPEAWFAPASQARRERCGVPEEVTFRTQPELAGEMVAGLVERKDVRFRWVLGDEFFGRDSALLDQIASLGKLYFVEVPHDTRRWRQRPGTYVPAWKGKGRLPSRLRLETEALPAETGTQMAAALPSCAWQRYTLHEGSKGPLVADVACLRVIAVRQGWPGPDVALILRREVVSGELKAFLTNAPPDTSVRQLAWLTAARWPVEQSIEAGKDERPLNQYALRSWRGWVHHVTLMLVAHLFLVRVQQALQPDAPALTLPPARLFLQVVLPKPIFDANAALRVLGQIQRANYAAYRSHRQRTLRKLGET